MTTSDVAAEQLSEEFDTWPASKYKDPIVVADGIKLRKDFSEIARNWWSRRWLTIIEAFGLGVRWQRAKMYATRGQVLSVHVESGLVRARVQGAEEEPYRVFLSVKTIPPSIWKTILQDFGRSSVFGISLAAGTLPCEEELESVFRNNGALLFPDRQGEMQTKCSCLDWSNPCKHIAAVYLLLAAEFDRDPYLIFKLRGLKLDDLFALLKRGQTADEVCPVDMPGASAQVTGPALYALNDQDNARRASVEHFWQCPVKPAAVFADWQPAEQIAALPASLGEMPFWRGTQEFLPSIRVAYESAPANVMQLLARRSAKPADIDE